MFPLIHVTSSVSIPTYYLVISLVVILSLVWVARRAEKFGLSRNIALDVSLILMICGFIGGRLMHVFYESLSYYQENWMRILYFWDGGFVFYGGALLSALAGILFLEWKVHTQTEKYLDMFAPVVALAYGLGRIGCLLAGCCYGRTCELPWAVAGRHPAQAYAFLWELGVVCILLGIESIQPADRKPVVLKNKGSVFYVWMILHGIGRLLMESFRDDFRGPSLGLSISSWISVCLIALGLFLLLSRKPASRSSAL